MKKEFEDIQRKAKEEVNQNRLEAFLDRIYPMVTATLSSNLKFRAFDNYEVFWDEEREETKEFSAPLKTAFDFVKENEAVQKSLNKLKESETGVAQTADEDWGGQDENKDKNKPDQPKVFGLDNDY